MAMSLQLRAGPMVCLPTDASGTEYVSYNGYANSSSDSGSRRGRGRGQAQGERQNGNGETKEREMVKSSEDEESSVTRGFDNSKEGQSGNEVLREDEASSFHKASGEEDLVQESIRSSEADSRSVKEEGRDLLGLGLQLEHSENPNTLRDSSQPNHGSMLGSDADSTESQSEAVVDGTRNDDDEESDDTTSDDWSSSDEESDGDSDQEACAPNSHDTRDAADDEKAHTLSLPSTSSSQDSAKEPEQLSTELLAEKRMAAAIELADMIERIQKQNALHALKRVQAMDTHFLRRVGKLVKHGEITGEWGDTPDDIRVRTTYDLSVYREESADDTAPQGSREETVEPQKEERLRLAYTVGDGQYQGRRLGIGEIHGPTASFDFLGRAPIEFSAETFTPPTFRYRLRCRKTGELFTVHTDEAAGEVWRRQGEALDELKAEVKKTQTVDDEEMKMCEDILKAREQRRRERRPGLLRWESTTD
ncbi:hypothetical protein C8Q70DRAFT_935631 [Cubamyces menziesii]|nr:hypothetical protein C8Q70DRAFT_935631 [Cubamyces menziesii]